MLALADRFIKKVADVTVGTCIVLVHVALAERTNGRRLASSSQSPPKLAVRN